MRAHRVSAIVFLLVWLVVACQVATPPASLVPTQAPSAPEPSSPASSPPLPTVTSAVPEPITVTLNVSPVSMTPAEMAVRAEAIVRGTVELIEPSRWTTADGTRPPNTTLHTISPGLQIYTDAIVHVEELPKGENVGSTIRVRQLGGTVGEDSMTVAGQQMLALNESVLLFLTRDDGRPDEDRSYYTVVGAMQGAFMIDGERAVSAGNEMPLADLLALAANPPDLTPPPLLYVADNTVVEQRGTERMTLATLSNDLGTVFDAKRLGDEIILLYERGLQRLHLDGQSETLLAFATPIHSGILVPAANNSVLLYTIWRDSRSAPDGSTTETGLYEPTTRVRSIVTLDRNSLALGLTEDRSGLYLLLPGQDPSYRFMQVVEVATGAIREPLEIKGEVFFAFSPDSRTLVLTDRRFVSEERMDGVLVRYDLTQRPLVPHTLALMYPRSHARTPLWSPDSQSLYFIFRGGDPYDHTAPLLGVWRLDIATDQMEQLTEGRVTTTTNLTSISPDGTWLLMTEENTDGAQLLHLPTGTLVPLDYPRMARFVGWR